jgi:hypothetical protein
MKGWIAAILAAGAFGVAGMSARGDAKATLNRDRRLLREHEEKLRKARIDEMRFERARARARERNAHLSPYERTRIPPQPASSAR